MRCWMHCPDTFSQRGRGLATLLYYAFLLDVCNHFYGKTTTPPISRGFQDNQWQGQKDSNPRHAVLETAALPAELYPYLACGTPVRRSTILVGLQGFEPGTGRL